MGKKELLRKLDSKYIDLGDKVQQLADTWEKLAWMVTEIREATAMNIVNQLEAVCDSKMLTELESRLRTITDIIMDVPEPDDPIYLDIKQRIHAKIHELGELRMDIIRLSIGIKSQYAQLSKLRKNLLSDCIGIIAGDNSMPQLQKHLQEALALLDA